jgi:hypothetical protein
MLKLLRKNGKNGVALYLAGKSAAETFLYETQWIRIEQIELRFVWQGKVQLEHFYTKQSIKQILFS